MRRRGPRRIPRLRLTCGLPVGRDSSLQSKQLRALHGKTHLPPQSTLQASDSLRVTETENQTQPISTELTFKPQPLIEHSVFAQAFQVSRVCVFLGGASREPGPSSHVALTGQGWGLGQQRPHTWYPDLEHVLLHPERDLGRTQVS